MEEVKDFEKTSETQSQTAINDPDSSDSLSENGRKLVNLIVKIIVNATLRECYEEGNKISEIQ